MMYMFMSSLTFTASLIFLQMNHPLSMGLMLLVQTSLICMMMGLLTKTFWFSYILFLIFLGGMLVLFIYVTSLASNEMFSFSMNITITSLLIMTTFFFMTMLLDKSLMMPFFNNHESMFLTNMNNLMEENSISLNKLYNFPTNLITIMLINYLFITLVAVVKITNIFYGPLRPMN